MTLRKIATNLLGLSLLASLPLHAQSISPAQQQFFDTLASLCAGAEDSSANTGAAKFVGEMTFPTEGQDSFAGKELVADFSSCGDDEIRIPFAVGDDRSRTWIISKTEQGLQLKHDHRLADGSPDEINMYGGLATADGKPLMQSFAADQHTATIIPAAASNVWTISLNQDQSEMTYHLERHAAPRFTAVLTKAED